MIWWKVSNKCKPSARMLLPFFTFKVLKSSKTKQWPLPHIITTGMCAVHWWNIILHLYQRWESMNFIASSPKLTKGEGIQTPKTPAGT